LVSCVFRRGVERVVLGFDRAAGARVAVAGEALGDDLRDAGLARGREQRVRALGAQAVRLGERAVEAAAEARVRERGGLVDDRVGRAVEHGPPDGARVEQVERDGRGAEGPDRLGLRGRRVGADHLVPGLDQLRDETASDRAGGACDEDSHGGFLSLGIVGLTP
jgi:hypothetical protein